MAFPSITWACGGLPEPPTQGQCDSGVTTVYIPQALIYKPSQKGRKVIWADWSLTAWDGISPRPTDSQPGVLPTTPRRQNSRISWLQEYRWIFFKDEWILSFIKLWELFKDSLWQPMCPLSNPFPEWLLSAISLLVLIMKILQRQSLAANMSSEPTPYWWTFAELRKKKRKKKS